MKILRSEWKSDLHMQKISLVIVVLGKRALIDSIKNTSNGIKTDALLWWNIQRRRTIIIIRSNL